MISRVVRLFASTLLGCLLVFHLAGQSTGTAKKTPEKVAATAQKASDLVTSAQLTQWMQANGVPRGSTATINQWEFAMNKLIPGGWHSYGVNFLNPAYQGKRDPTRYTADQFLQGLRKYEAERNQAKPAK